jgi:hypothetical protein
MKTLAVKTLAVKTLGVKTLGAKTLGVALLASAAFAGFAHAADVLPTTKPGPPPPPNCFSSIWAYIDSTVADCPLTYGPFTVYATLDAGLMYDTHGAPWSPASSTEPRG